MRVTLNAGPFSGCFRSYRPRPSLAGRARSQPDRLLGSFPARNPDPQLRQEVRLPRARTPDLSRSDCQALLLRQRRDHRRLDSQGRAAADRRLKAVVVVFVFGGGCEELRLEGLPQLGLLLRGSPSLLPHLGSLAGEDHDQEVRGLRRQRRTLQGLPVPSLRQPGAGVRRGPALHHLLPSAETPGSHLQVLLLLAVKHHEQLVPVRGPEVRQLSNTGRLGGNWPTPVAQLSCYRHQRLSDLKWWGYFLARIECLMGSGCCVLG